MYHLTSSMYHSLLNLEMREICSDFGPKIAVHMTSTSLVTSNDNTDLIGYLIKNDKHLTRSIIFYHFVYQRVCRLVNAHESKKKSGLSPYCPSSTRPS